MDIVCPKCSTEYEFDDDKVTAAGVTVKCTTCSYTFKVRRKQVVETEPVQGEGGDAKRPWMIRTVDGALLKFNELTTLQQWIVERKVNREDQISRSGETWKRLGDIAELSSFFQVVDAAVAAEKQSGAHPPANSTPAGAASAPPPARERRTTGARPQRATGAREPSGPNEIESWSAGDEPAFAAQSGQLGAVSGGAAWEGAGARLSQGYDSVDPLDDEIPQRSMGKFVGLVLLALVVLGVGGFALAKPQTFKGLFRSLFGKEKVSQAYTKARERFLQDDEESLRAADQLFAKAPKDSALARAGRAEVYTTWAQHLTDEAELLDREAASKERAAQRLLSSLPKAQPDKKTRRRRRRRKGKKANADKSKSIAAQAQALTGEAKTLRLRGSKRRAEAKQKLEVAASHVQAALATKSERAEVFRAVADLHRLQNKTDVPSLVAKVRKTAPDDPETYYVEGLYWRAQGNISRAIEMLKASILKTKSFSKQTLLRAAFQLAMIHLRAGRRTEARQQADTILALRPKHRWTRLLITRISAEEKDPPEASAGTPTPSTPTPATPATPQPGTAAGTGAGTAAGATTPAAGSGTGGTAAATPGKPSTPRSGGRAPQGYAALIKAADKAAEYGKTGKALTYYEKALEQNPRGVAALVGLGYCDLDMQRYSSALARFRKALKISSTHGDAMIGMADTYKALGNKRKAIDYYRAYVKTYPAMRKAAQARRNIQALERQLGAGAPAPVKAPTPAPSKPSPVKPAPAPAPAKPAPAKPAPAKPAPAEPAPAKPAPAASPAKPAAAKPAG